MNLNIGNMKTAGTHTAWIEAFEFAKDPRPYEVKVREYERKQTRRLKAEREVKLDLATMVWEGFTIKTK